MTTFFTSFMIAPYIFSFLWMLLSEIMNTVSSIKSMSFKFMIKAIPQGDKFMFSNFLLINTAAVSLERSSL